ncbi:MAG: calcium-binding protein, partial [Phycisphaerales bacterium]|nr:calcium-binding protein [Phycisphaerales bacterium]
AGNGLDTVSAEADNDMVFGDNGQVLRTNVGALDLVISLAPDEGAIDTIWGNEGNDIVIAGLAADTVHGNSGDDTVIGDNGRIDYSSDVRVQINTINPALGAVDVLNGNEDDDILIGGTSGDTISGHGGDDLIVGDQVVLDYTNGSLTQITTSDGADAEFGDDLIDAGNGNNIVFGGLGSDDITSFEGRDAIAADQAIMLLLESGIWVSVTTNDFARGGADIIRSGAGDDVVFGGYGRDHVIAGAHDDIVLGDNGLMLRHANGARSIITTTNPTLGDDDLIFGDEQNDIIFGGTAEDEIYGGSENDLIFGDHGQVDYSLPPNDNFHSIDMAVADAGGDDFIRGNAGDDIIIAGQGDDTVYGDANDDDIIGGHNVAGGIDELNPADSTNDRLDGGSENDVIAGDNAWIIRRGDAVSPRVRMLSGTTLYNADGSAAVTGAAQAIPTGAASRDIVLLDHSTTATSDTFGNDFIAGGAHDDLIFGQLGEDTIQGDSTIDHSLTAGSLSLTTDGDDYIEGNGG